MTTIAESLTSDTSSLWNNCDEAEKAINDSKTLRWYVAGSLTLAAVIHVLPAARNVIALQSSAAVVAFFAAYYFGSYLDYKICQPLGKHFYAKEVPGSPLYAVVMLLGAVSMTKLLPTLGLVGFAVLCVYSSYLLTKSLTQKRYLELGFERLKEIIASENTEKECLLIDRVSRDQGYPCIYLRPEFYVPTDLLSEEQILELLVLGYKHKKIISFSDISFFKTFMNTSIDLERTKTIYSNIFNSNLYAGFVEKALDLYYKYKQRLKELDEPLDFVFIHAQVKPLVAIAESRLLLKGH